MVLARSVGRPLTLEDNITASRLCFFETGGSSSVLRKVLHLKSLYSCRIIYLHHSESYIYRHLIIMPTMCCIRCERCCAGAYFVIHSGLHFNSYQYTESENDHV